MTEVKEFSKRLDKIFEDGEPTKALIIDAYIKTNPNALKQGQTLPIDSVVGQSEQLKPMVFELANKLAIAGEGDAAVGMHRIHNRL